MDTPILVNVQQAAEMLGVSIWTIREYVASGDLPTIKLPSTKGSAQRSRRLLIAVTDLQAFVTRCRA